MRTAIDTLVVPEDGGLVSASEMGGVDAGTSDRKGEAELASAASVDDVHIPIGLVFVGLGGVVQISMDPPLVGLTFVSEVLQYPARVLEASIGYGGTRGRTRH